MKSRLQVLCLFFIAAIAASAADYALTARRAARNYHFGEWAQAGALFELMLDQHPDSARTYSRAIVAASMLADTARTVGLLERAMNHGVALDSVVEGVRSESLAKGASHIYEEFLNRIRARLPYMARAVDARLLDYYEFRNDGPQIVRLSRAMLEGLPDSPRYLMALARGSILTGDTATAEAAWQRILEDDPRNIDALRAYGLYMHQSGRPAEARPLLERADRIAPTPYITKILNSDTRR